MGPCSIDHRHECIQSPGPQEAPEHLLASPFSGQNPTTSMAVVPEEADPIPSQSSAGDISGRQQVPQGFPPLTAPGGPHPITPPASMHSAMALASHGPYGDHEGGRNPLAGGLPPGPIRPMIGAHQSARPGFHEGEHMAGNNGMQPGLPPAQGDSLHLAWPSTRCPQHAQHSMPEVFGVRCPAS